MCMFKQPKTQAPTLPPETARSQAPDRDAIGQNARRRTTDNLRSRATTILTGGQGDIDEADTAKKALLGV